MAISSGTGMVLAAFVSSYEGSLSSYCYQLYVPGSFSLIFYPQTLRRPRMGYRFYYRSRIICIFTRSCIPSRSSSLFNSLEPGPLLATLMPLLITIPVEIIHFSIPDIFHWLNLAFLFVIFIVFFCFAMSSYIDPV